MVLLLSNATATFIATRGGKDYFAYDVPIMLSSTLSMAYRDPQSQSYRNMVNWDPDLMVDDGSPDGTPIQPGDAIENIVDVNGRQWYGNMGRIELQLPRYDVGIGLGTAMAYIITTAGQ